ncbi:sensor domain-containing protein [Mycobacterium sp. M1]|uniref:Sensor domain-containing protein n=1 Tax=Mycolicibacter acidiphilus TaxID=2835306 RepID=A0ABS5RJT7_9MYCO|nr:sensor domain-containing protein [Mycolicibacter acidiphilus]
MGALLVLSLLPVAALTGCTRVVTGKVRPAPGLAPTPVTGTAVRQVLLDDAELTSLLHRPFLSDPNLAPRFGGVDKLPNGWASAGPKSCIGTAVGGQRVVYDGSDVQDVAHEFWNVARSDPSSMTGVAEGVMALPTAADAEALFTKFADQWSHCDGVTVIRHDGYNSDASGEITAASDDGSVLTATVQTTVDGDPGLMVTRALSVQVNCVVDVDVYWLTGVFEPGAPAGDTTAVDIARAMNEKVRGITG